jgi:flagellar hook assembly protein FlgD
VVVVATANGKSVTKWVDLTIDRTVTAFAAAAGPGGTTTFSFTLAASVPVRLEIDDCAGDIAAELYQGTLPAGSNTVSWDGNAYGRPLPPGQYAAVLTVTDDLGLVPFSIPLTLPAPPG